MYTSDIRHCILPTYTSDVCNCRAIQCKKYIAQNTQSKFAAAVFGAECVKKTKKNKKLCLISASLDLAVDLQHFYNKICNKTSYSGFIAANYFLLYVTVKGENMQQNLQQMSAQVNFRCGFCAECFPQRVYEIFKISSTLLLLWIHCWKIVNVSISIFYLGILCITLTIFSG